ncbi:Formylglycine-generating enzyme, required for sulfatase activity, contains SUMF1/FGE domain [Arenibacter nanhaiticus]|uniref:Formylglycine-generating enzyme, required for sulfatase activity, contains SUMF1/FGE domain n=1 Tax=Arenibacter nanhaiticus TaxID=558155 RepID=A0A1M6FAT8_9FLAO|nr:Formylglycine-generating enzyme, required for sulfatase activity, contains SUMF1/FGE domain [Arenibacter nanhaiticus]
MLKINPSLRNSSLFFVPVIFMSLQSCKTQKTVVQNSPNILAAKEEFTENIPATDISFDMVLIPEGSFMMGSPASEPNRKADEGPVKEVTLDAFWMGKYELTWDVFELFYKQNRELFQEMDKGKLADLDAITRPSPPYEDPSYGMGKAGYPAVSMSAYSALVFCKWLSSVTGTFYRLPTEAEWEYAAKAGTNTAYSFGDDISKIDDYAVYYKNANNQYAKVGTKLPNPWGLYDMHGNVAEWTLDEYKENAYAMTKANNPWVQPTVIHPRVIRGGSWDDDAEVLRSSRRVASSLKLQKRDPQIPKSFWWNTDSNFIGFRLVSPKVQPSPEEQKKFWQTVLDE